MTVDRDCKKNKFSPRFNRLKTLPSIWRIILTLTGKFLFSTILPSTMNKLILSALIIAAVAASTIPIVSDPYDCQEAIDEIGQENVDLTYCSKVEDDSLYAMQGSCNWYYNCHQKRTLCQRCPDYIPNVWITPVFNQAKQVCDVQGSVPGC